MVDAGATLTPLSVMVLALLRESDMHPYEMVRLLRVRRGGRLIKVTNGTLYHSVARLLDRGLIAETGTDRDGNRPARTTYRLASAGDAAMRSWVRNELARADRPAQFRVALAEAHNLDRADVIDLLRIRRAALAEQEQLHAADLQDAREAQVPEQFVMEPDHQQALLRAELAWMDAQLARFDTETIPWGTDGLQDSGAYVAQRRAARQ